jgi:microcystin degradation protein MlrC
MPRIAIASIFQENNNFSPVRTHYDDFAPVFGEGVLERHRSAQTEMGGFIEVLSAARCRIEPVCAASAITANRLARADFGRLVKEFSHRLAKIRRPEALLFALHGAQTAEGADDAEGHLLGRAREVLGPEVPIVATLDLHANVTRAMAARADAIVGYHTYPHVDLFETGVKATRLALRILSGEVKPAMAFRKLPLIVPAENMQTTSGPMHRLMSRAERLERSGAAEAVSLFGVQPWLDIAEMGCSVVTVTNNNRRAAQRQVDALARQFWNLRREFDVRLTRLDAAIRQARRIQGGPVVLSESADSTGSGSPGDSTAVLKALLAADLKAPAALFLVDSEAVDRAVRAGVGKTITMRIGGRLDRKHSHPVQVTGMVHLISDGRWMPRGKGYGSGVEISMGRSVVLKTRQIHVLIAERSVLTVDPELFRSHGIEPRHMKIVVVKSPNGFRAEYEPMAKAIFIVDTPGASTANLLSVPYRRVPRPIYPLDADTTLILDKPGRVDP